MGESVYLAHAYKASYKSKETYKPILEKYHYAVKTVPKAIIGRRTSNPYGNYASPYYDPVKRAERYQRSKDHVTRPYGVGASETSRSSGGGGRGGGSSGGGRGGRGGGSSGGGRGGGSSGGGRGKSATSSKGINDNLAEQIKVLRNESQLNTEAQREAAKRKIEDLRNDLYTKVQSEREKAASETEKTENMVEIRGIANHLKSTIENLQNQSQTDIERVSADLKSWIENERDSLERRIAALYKARGKTYTPRLSRDRKNASSKRETEVNSRADSIYKQKTSK